MADISLASFKATYAFPLSHTDDEVRAWIRDELLPGTETWLAIDPDGTTVGFMSLGVDVVDQLYLRPDRTGRGIGTRFIGLAKSLRPGGLELYTFQVNTGARRFYERHGFRVVDLDDGARNEEGQPDVRYRWLPVEPAEFVTDGEVGSTVSRDGTRIAWVRSGSGPPIVLVHGATADHTAWRTAAPLLAPTHALFAIDRRGRGSSGDHLPYAIAREYEDVAAVVDAISASEGRPVDVVGHSFGGRVGLGAALLTSNLRRLVVYATTARCSIPPAARAACSSSPATSSSTRAATPRRRSSFYGQEKNRDTIRIAKMNLAVHGLEGKIAEAITYYQDEHTPRRQVRLRDGQSAVQRGPGGRRAASRATRACPSACRA